MRTVKTALVGFGAAGSDYHAPLIAAEPAIELVAIVTSSPGRVAEAQARFPQARVVPDVASLLADSDSVDAVVIASPHPTHAQIATDAMRAGLDVVVDKPVALTVDDANRLRETAQMTGAILTVFQNHRWSSDFLTLSAVVESGKLGDVYQLESAVDRWAPHVGDGWRDVRTTPDGGGITYDLAPHLLDQAVQLLGPIQSLHSELTIRRTGAVGDDDSFLAATHESGARSRIWMSSVVMRPHPRFRAVGSHGVLTIERRNGSLAATLTSSEGETRVPIRPGEADVFYRRFAAAVLDRGRPPVDVDDAIDILRWIETAVRSTDWARVRS